MLTMVRKTSGKGFHRAENSSRRYRYHSRGLVPLSFDGSSPDPVSLVASVGNRNSDYFCSAFNSTLINGKGRYPGGPDVPLAIVNVQHGKRSVIYIFQCFGYVLTFCATLATDSA